MPRQTDTGSRTQVLKLGLIHATLHLVRLNSLRWRSQSCVARVRLLALARTRRVGIDRLVLACGGRSFCRVHDGDEAVGQVANVAGAPVGPGGFGVARIVLARDACSQGPVQSPEARQRALGPFVL